MEIAKEMFGLRRRHPKIELPCRLGWGVVAELIAVRSLATVPQYVQEATVG